MLKFTLAALLFATPTIAQTPLHGMPVPSDSPASKAYKAAMDHMMGATPPPTGNPDQDFVAAMLPHHQAAVDMAHTELQYGKDPALRGLAQAIIKAQDKEIAFMRQWQKKHQTP